MCIRDRHTPTIVATAVSPSSNNTESDLAAIERTKSYAISNSQTFPVDLKDIPIHYALPTKILGDLQRSPVVADGLRLGYPSNYNKCGRINENCMSHLDGGTNGPVSPTSVKRDVNERTPVPRTTNSRSFVTYRYSKSCSSTDKRPS